MALNDAAADAALDVYINTIKPPVSATDRARIHASLGLLVRAIYGGIVASAVVSPDALNVGGTAVTGTGKIS